MSESDLHQRARLIIANAKVCALAWPDGWCAVAYPRPHPTHTPADAPWGHWQALEVPCFIQPEDIVRGNPRMNLAFCAQVFNTHPGLTITEAEAYEMAVRAGWACNPSPRRGSSH